MASDASFAEGFVFGGPDGSGGTEIYLMRSDGSDRRQLTDTPGSNFAPAWSPDGRWIAFVSTRAGVPGQVYVMGADGSGARRITNPTYGYADGGVAWSPDGASLVFVCRASDWPQEELCIIDSEGTGLRRILPSGWRGIQPAWAPDGRTIAFSGWPAGEPGYLHLWTVAPEGGSPTLLSATRTEGHEEEPAWSPDGMRVAFRATRPRPPYAAGLPEVFTMQRDGSDRRPLIENMSPLESSFAPTWSRDGRRIAFARGGETAVLYTVAADGTDQQMIRDIGSLSGLSWRDDPR